MKIGYDVIEYYYPGTGGDTTVNDEPLSLEEAIILAREKSRIIKDPNVIGYDIIVTGWDGFI